MATVADGVKFMQNTGIGYLHNLRSGRTRTGGRGEIINSFSDEEVYNLRSGRTGTATGGVIEGQGDT